MEQLYYLVLHRPSLELHKLSALWSACTIYDNKEFFFIFYFILFFFFFVLLHCIKIKKSYVPSWETAINSPFPSLLSVLHTYIHTYIYNYFDVTNPNAANLCPELLIT